ncbi:hypothetical protein NMY22_g1915 [Coprinellus aureogranulatus]|nr:hypothetical protein NMY22_g1915 [Coprinellus aureogranulatus]
MVYREDERGSNAKIAISTSVNPGPEPRQNSYFASLDRASGGSDELWTSASSRVSRFQQQQGLIRSLSFVWYSPSSPATRVSSSSGVVPSLAVLPFASVNTSLSPLSPLLATTGFPKVHDTLKPALLRAWNISLITVNWIRFAMGATTTGSVRKPHGVKRTAPMARLRRQSSP